MSNRLKSCFWFVLKWTCLLLFEYVRPILSCILGFLILGGFVLLPGNIPDSILGIGMAAYVIIVATLLLALARLLDRIKAAFKNRVARWGKNAEETQK
ncbi:MAG: hypothetical protein LBU11_02980 [Zoogloeaceae bacterium]|jgi:hypothetical protein|nr:hypothetical protein [Zoogloeaceae bacterium]